LPAKCAAGCVVGVGSTGSVRCCQAVRAWVGCEDSVHRAKAFRRYDRGGACPFWRRGRAFFVPASGPERAHACPLRLYGTSFRREGQAVRRLFGRRGAGGGAAAALDRPPRPEPHASMDASGCLPWRARAEAGFARRRRPPSGQQNPRGEGRAAPKGARPGFAIREAGLGGLPSLAAVTAAASAERMRSTVRRRASASGCTPQRAKPCSRPRLPEWFLYRISPSGVGEVRGG
jgi:hypothetical protein